ncbi:hypothetical protein ACHAWC_010739 [Mediolabrus comicus]
MTTPPRPTNTTGDEGIAASLVSPGLSSSLYGSSTFNSQRGLGSAFPGASTLSAGGGPDVAPNSSSSRTPAKSASGGAARGDLRSKLVRERSRSSAAFASSSLQQLRTPQRSAASSIRAPPNISGRVDEESNSDSDDDDEDYYHYLEEEQYPALFTNFCYRGMEVIFTAIPGDKDHECYLLGIHARTRVPFQKCHFFSANNNNNKSRVKIVELTSHPLTGWIFAADSIGNIHSFYPIRADPMKEAYGKFRWVCGSVARTRVVFGYSELPAEDVNEESIEDLECFFRKRRSSSLTSIGHSTSSLGAAAGSDNNNQQQQQHYPLNDGQPPLPKSPGGKTEQGQYRVMVRCSITEKRVLVVHKDQLAIFDFSAAAAAASNGGDGCAIALSLDGEGVGVPYPFGIRTFVRDWEDGSSSSDVNEINNNAANMRPPTHNHRRTASGVKGLPESHVPPLPKKNNFDGLMESVFGDGGGSGGVAAPPKEQQGDISTSENTSSVATGILYKPGQFLVHSSPVTRLSFRGFGTRTSALHHNSGWNEQQEEGNDLLLTSCSGDCSVRIFSQNSWRQLMHWTCPPKSRADWVRGISAANVGDLDSSPTNDTRKKKDEGKEQSSIPKQGADTSVSTGKTVSTTLQSHSGTPSQSCDTSVASDTSGGINRVLLGNHHYYNNYAQASSALPSHSVPGTHAGAWIAELTFRNAFPALRLSRLSYMKTGGDDALPAHFESVAAILPPGSLNEELLLAEDDGANYMDVEGIWPVWDPWEPDLKKPGTGAGDAGNDKAGSTAFGGSSSSGVTSPTSAASPTAGQRWVADGSDLGGTHIPPSDIRITSSYSRADCLAQIEMPLWGDKDFGAMEFGAPLRYVMSMPERRVGKITSELPLEYESGSRLCARAALGNRSIELLWRKHGAINLEKLNSGIESFEQFKDLSLTPLPICLPSLSVLGFHHKSHASDNLQQHQTFDKHGVASLHWWPDENFGGPPRLVALTRGGVLIVYEMPPPWSALEPPMPTYDPFDGSESRGSSVYSDFGMEEDDDVLMSQDSFHDENRRTEYEVAVAPHPDFGLGLRLEAQGPGMPTIAGSFKKHPLSGGRLPAERSGAITLGDELLAVNDVNLEGFRFEDAIATVRQIGFDSHGEPLRMRFRKGRGKRSGSSMPASVGSKGSKRSSASRRTPDSKSPSVVIEGIDDKSLATVEVGADAEYQQEFGRIIAVVRDAIIDPADSATFLPSPAMLLLPWNFGKGAVVSKNMYGGALILWAVPGKRIIKAGRLEALLDIDPENARFDEMGQVTMDDNKSGDGASISSITFVSSTERGWLVAVCDSVGSVSLLFVEISSQPSSNESDERPVLTSSFRQYSSIFNPCSITGSKNDPSRSLCTVRPFSLELFGYMDGCIGRCKDVKIYSALPCSLGMNGSKDIASTEYCHSTVSLSQVQGHEDEFILDFCWVSSGFEDAFPWLLVFTRSSAIIYHRSCLQTTWGVIATLSYAERLCLRSSSPHDVFPHLVTALRSAIPSNDEQMRLRSGWHPESILASICTEEDGTKLALNSYVRGIYSWLSQWMVPEEATRPSWVGQGSLSNVPFRVLNDKSSVSAEDGKENGTSAALMATLSLGSRQTRREQSEGSFLLSELQSALDTAVKEPSEDLGAHQANRSKEFILAMSQGNEGSVKMNRLPAPLQKLRREELVCLWAIGEVLARPPSFERLDSYSQLCLFCVSLMRALLNTNNSDDPSSDATKSMNDVLSYESGRPVLTSQKKSSSDLDRARIKFDNIASAGYLAALMSDSQLLLINSCRPVGEKFSWDVARSVGLPFWVRSDKELFSIAEEVAQTIYKDTRLVMDCALYYIAMRNMKKLRALAATDRSDSGKKFFKFISDNDFSSERGRNSAEKNAYSLLRKRKYASAASFFLLAEPPMIKTALDVIRLQLQDTSLAFFIARLIENARSSGAAPSGGGLNIGGAFNLSSMGGGGGFAGTGSTIDDVKVSVDKFEDWTPKLGANATAVLSQKGLNTEKDVCLDSLKLLWLGRPNEAKLRLAHTTETVNGRVAALQDLSLPSVACDMSMKESNTTVLRGANAVINFCSGPMLLKGLNPKKRVLWSSALIVSRALGRSGIEIPSMRILQRVADPLYEEKSSNSGSSVKQNGVESSSVLGDKSSAASSSIFDSFDTAPPQRNQTNPIQEANTPSSSIFDSFDAAPSKTRSAHVKDEPAPSIFDSFDTAPQKAKQSQPTSIFDSFDTAPQKPKPSAKQSDDMASSIFDSFDAAPQKPKLAAKQSAKIEACDLPSAADEYYGRIFLETY